MISTHTAVLQLTVGIRLHPAEGCGVWTTLHWIATLRLEAGVNEPTVLDTVGCATELLPHVECVTTTTILGVTVTNHLSVSEYVSRIISKCAQPLLTLKNYVTTE